MAFVFLHTSDLHIGKPFAGFDSEIAALLRNSRSSAIGRLARAAAECQARHVLVAGDTFDRQGLADDTIRTALSRMAGDAGLVWHIIPGNHDADCPGGIWERAMRLDLPPNVVVHRKASPVQIESGVHLLPAPLEGRVVTADPTAWMDSAATPADAIRIGLAHGSARGFGSEASAAVLIDSERRNRAGLAYLALGDWHGAKEVAEGVWYSGTPEPDQFAENDPGSALVVTVESSTSVRVKRVPTAERIWLKRAVACRTADDVAALGPELSRCDFDTHNALMELTLTGNVSLATRLAIDAALATLRSRLLVLRTRMDLLQVTADAADLAALDDPQLRRAATRLAERAADATQPAATVAAEALRELYALANAAAGGRP